MPSPSETLPLPPSLPALFTPHLPPSPNPNSSSSRPFLTLTFATSLDSALSLAPGVRTTLSGPESKTMTHYLRSRHSAILIGVGTALADDPGLNCRIEGGASPRPIILDPKARWAFGEEVKVLQLAGRGEGKAPFVFVGAGVQVDDGRREVLERYGGKYVVVEKDERGRFRWTDVLGAIAREGFESVMVEGGGEVINSLLKAPENELVDSVIVTVAPTWLGKGGVVVSPERTVDANGEPKPPVRLTEVEWHPLGEDIVLCGKIKR
ncbi:riboflavin biosynthesis protein RibD domain-protein [Podospora aff. communis PSN243]|uniref:2,5-diamino-6-ribosylamino-4(3H)-pyrimidinone 5'-phosphate reductase n=1 Tax=Podospora aff. communis PSN243 TaxID=3040156 RepID=A0AAV9GZ92_9PEZI|nr:riboflavin biosynthesis protein RibD domain-protein [Podospora aff. communis PSN243]